MRFLIMLFVFVAFAFANPAPLGFEIDKATYEQVTAKYQPKSTEKSYTGGTLIYIDKDKIELENLISDVRLNFDTQGKLVAVWLEFDGNHFSKLLPSLSKKYIKIIEKTDNFIKFEENDCTIALKLSSIIYADIATLQQKIEQHGIQVIEELERDITYLSYSTKKEAERRKEWRNKYKKKQNEREQRIKDNLKTL